MAIVNYSYCNASLGKNVTIQFDQGFGATYQIVGHTINGNCSSAQPSVIAYIPPPLGTGFSIGYLTPTNVAPYAQYIEFNSGSNCSAFQFTSINVGNASNNLSQDGSLIINVAGKLFYTTYRIIGPSGTIIQPGTTTPNANTFTGLKPGEYSVIVETAPFSVVGTPEICTIQQFVTVGQNAVICDLGLGTITTESAAGLGNGKIKVVNLTGFQAPVEYRLNSGAWQDSGEFIGLNAGTYNVQVRYKEYPICVANRNVDVANTDSCDVAILDVITIHEQSKYAKDGAIQIVAQSSQGPMLFSINDGVDYSSENTFVNLEPKVYQVRVIDAGGCEDVQTVEIFKYKRAYIKFPIVNSHRVVLSSGPMIKTNARQNFDNTLFGQMRFPGVEPSCYHERVQPEDSNTIQFKSSYLTNTLRVYDSQDVLKATYIAEKKTLNMNKSESFPALFASAGSGKTQVFFENGLPYFVEIGMDIQVTDQVLLNGTYEVEDIIPGIGQASGYQVLIISVTSSGLLSGNAVFEYDVEPFEAFEVLLIWGAFTTGKFYFTVEGQDPQFQNYLAESEPIEVKDNWKDTLVIEYKDYDNSYEVIYETGIKHRLRVQGSVKWPLPGGERTVYKDSKVRTIKLEEYNTRNPQLSVQFLPPYLLEKLKLAFAMDWFTVEEVEYQCEEDFEPEYFEHEALHNGAVKLIQVDFENENSDDQGPDIDITILDTNDTLLAINP